MALVPKCALIELLGEPADRLTIDETEFLFYYASRMNTAQANERRPLAVANGMVVGKGQVYYYDFLNAHRGIKDTASHQS